MLESVRKSIVASQVYSHQAKWKGRMAASIKQAIEACAMTKLSAPPAKPVPWKVTYRRNMATLTTSVIAQTWYDARSKAYDTYGPSAIVLPITEQDFGD